ncbi:MAG: DMT family transporter [Rhodospirillaceae bacterium]|jgi:drug/metabolite transporter (DMT)-like permease|nr:DMT family transporter [Rhodospirillaceae bacterium]
MQIYFQRWQALPGNVRGSLIILIASLTSVVMSSLIKHVGQTIPVIEILFVRQILVMIIISPVIFRNLGTVFKSSIYGMHFLRASLSVIAMYTGFTAVVNMPLAEVTAITFARILFTTILAIIFLKEIIGMRRWISIIIGFVGVLVIIHPDPDNINIYALMAIVSALFVSGIQIVLRKLSQVDKPSTILAFHSVFIALAMAVPTYYQWVMLNLDEMIYILMIGILMSLMQWLFIQAFKAGEAAAIAPMEYVRLLYAGVIGIIFFAEIPTVWTLSGAAIIVASTLYTMHRNAVRTPQK